MAVMSNKRTLYLAFGCVMPEIRGRLWDHVSYITGRLHDDEAPSEQTQGFGDEDVCARLDLFFFFFQLHHVLFFFYLPLFSVTPQSIYIIEAHGEDGYG